jgi:hypothetical protein
MKQQTKRAYGCKESKLSASGNQRAMYKNRLAELINQKKDACARGDLKASERISAEMRELIGEEAKLSSRLVGVVIRT